LGLGSGVALDWREEEEKGMAWEVEAEEVNNGRE